MRPDKFHFCIMEILVRLGKSTFILGRGWWKSGNHSLHALPEERSHTEHCSTGLSSMGRTILLLDWLDRSIGSDLDPVEDFCEGATWTYWPGNRHFIL